MSQRVLHIIGSRERRGAQRQLALLVRDLPRDEFEPHVCLLGPRRDAEWLALDNAHVHNVEQRWSIDPRAYRQLGQLINRLRPAIVQSWLFDAKVYGQAAASRADVPVRVAVERYVDRQRSRLHWSIDRWVAGRTSCLVANSADVLGFHLDHDVRPRTAEVIADGVEPPERPPAVSREELLASLRVAGPVRLIMAAGSLRPENRFKDLIWAADILKIIHGDVHLVILGDGPHRRRLERYQKNVRIEDRVHVVGWRDDARQLLSLADLFWLASDQQGAPSALLEAMAAGVPVVTTDTASHRAIVESGRTGFLVPTGDRAALAKYANRLLENRELSRTIGEAARRDVLARFSVAAMVDNYAALYRRLLAS